VNQLGDAVSLTIIGHKAVEDCLPLNEALKQHKNQVCHMRDIENMKRTRRVCFLPF
jgi:hypothetical protein